MTINQVIINIQINMKTITLSLLTICLLGLSSQSFAIGFPHNILATKKKVEAKIIKTIVSKTTRVVSQKK
jgi:hypothetical protein